VAAGSPAPAPIDPALGLPAEKQTREGGMYRFLECTAGQYMTTRVASVTREMTLRELETLFEQHDFNSFPVVEDGTMLGIVTKFDFLRAFTFTTGQIIPPYDELMNRPVEEIMTEAAC
jgi:CBS domain-containing protein